VNDLNGRLPQPSPFPGIPAEHHAPSPGQATALELGVEGLAGRPKCSEERPPVLLVLPAVDRQQPVGPGGSHSHLLSPSFSVSTSPCSMVTQQSAVPGVQGRPLATITYR
jgi:hypothetical protein